MTNRPNTADYRQLFLSDTPLLDMRAPVEFEKGAFPQSINIPLLDDQQREAVGTCYKEQGQDSAIELGWKLATPEIKTQRQQAWLEHIQQHPQGYLYCFRGGLRSRLSQQLIAEAGVDYPMVTDGYKAMRRFLIDEMERIAPTLPLVLISGRTGSGKTLVIHDLMDKLKCAVDLEGLANHRGSAFGRQIDEQPSQIDFENRLTIKLMKLQAANVQRIFVEDEGKLIGRAALQPCFKENMQQAPLVTLETSIEERIDIALADYVTDALPQYQARYGEELGGKKFREQILGNVQRIKKRLGGEKFQPLYDSFNAALNQLENNGNADGFRAGIATLLTDYYDPMYDYQRNLREGREIFRGNRKEILEWAKENIENS